MNFENIEKSFKDLARNHAAYVGAREIHDTKKEKIISKRKY